MVLNLFVEVLKKVLKSLKFELKILQKPCNYKDFHFVNYPFNSNLILVCKLVTAKMPNSIRFENKHYQWDVMRCYWGVNLTFNIHVLKKPPLKEILMEFQEQSSHPQRIHLAPF